MSPEDRIQFLEDRITELETLLMGSHAELTSYRRLGLPARECRVLGVLMKRKILSREAGSEAIHGGRPEADRPETDKDVDVSIWKIRNVLDPLGVKVGTERGVGWSMAEAEKTKLLQIIGWMVEDLPRFNYRQPQGPRRFHYGS